MFKCSDKQIMLINYDTTFNFIATHILYIYSIYIYRERQTHRHTDRRTDRQTDREKEREREREGESNSQV